MQNFPKPSRHNNGLLVNFWYVHVKNVVSIPDEVNGKILDDIELLPDIKWNEGYSSRGKLQFKQTEKDNGGGTPIYMQDLSGFCPDDTPEITDLFHKLKYDNRYITLHKDTAGDYKLSGTLTQPMKFTAELTKPGEFDKYKGYAYSFANPSNKPALHYQGAFESDNTVVANSNDLSELSCGTLNDATTGISDGQYSNCLVPDRTAAATIAGIVQAPAGVISDIRDGISNTFSYTRNFAIGTAKYAYFRAKAAGIIKAETLTNLSAVVYKKITDSAVTTVVLPITVAEGDLIEIQPTVNNIALVSSIVLKGYYDTTNETIAIPTKGTATIGITCCAAANQCHLFDESILLSSGPAVAGGVWVVNPVVLIVNMPAGFTPTVARYRAINKHFYVFGNNKVSKIDADPTSLNFGQVTSLAGVVNAATTISGAFPTQQTSSGAYDFINDVFVISAGTTANGVYFINPATNAITTCAAKMVYDLSQINHIRFIEHNQCFLFTGYNGETLLYDHVNNKIIFGFKGSVNPNGTAFNPKNGRFYFSMGSNVNCRDKEMRIITSISPSGFGYGACCVAKAQNKLFGGSAGSGNNIWVIDMATNTGLTAIAKASLAAGETNSKALYYSDTTDRVLVQGNGDRIHVLNPNLSGAAAYLGYFVTATHANPFEYISGMCNNQIMANG
jgi:hypothetical protein